jgi:hypothetical protein
MYNPQFGCLPLFDLVLSTGFSDYNGKQLKCQSVSLPAGSVCGQWVVGKAISAICA